MGVENLFSRKVAKTAKKCRLMVHPNQRDAPYVFCADLCTGLPNDHKGKPWWGFALRFARGCLPPGGEFVLLRKERSSQHWHVPPVQV
jgi:hypothetical protein